MKNNYYVYAHINPTNDEVFYIGKGKGRRAHSKYHRSDYWKNYVKKYGGFLVLFININLTEEESFELEKQWISNIGRKDLGKGPLINLTDGGDGCSNLKHKQDTKKRISDYFKGKPLSEEHKLKIKKSTIGRVITNEQKEKISKTLKIKYSKGIIKTKRNNCKKIIIDGVEYDSIIEAVKKLNSTKDKIKYRLKSLNYPNYQYA